MNILEEIMQSNDIMNAMIYMVNNHEFDRLLSTSKHSQKKLIKKDQEFLTALVDSERLYERSSMVIIEHLESSEVLKSLLRYAIREEQGLNSTIVLNPNK